MSTTIPRPSMMAIERVAIDAAETDSLALYKLTNVIKLAAFACETRRTLEGINNALTHDKEARAAISKNVNAWRTWTEMDDVTGEVLQDVAMQLDALNAVMSQRPFELKSLGGADHE
ncbi:MAG: hypothetical protein ABIR56_05580 [Polaromonas sp.]